VLVHSLNCTGEDFFGDLSPFLRLGPRPKIVRNCGVPWVSIIAAQVQARIGIVCVKVATRTLPSCDGEIPRARKLVLLRRPCTVNGLPYSTDAIVGEELGGCPKAKRQLCGACVGIFTVRIAHLPLSPPDGNIAEGLKARQFWSGLADVVAALVLVRIAEDGPTSEKWPWAFRRIYHIEVDSK